MIEPRIVVGVDGSLGSLDALRVALEEARLRQAPLRVVTAWQVTEHASTGPRGASISVRNLMSSSRRHGKQLCVAAESVDECSPAGLVDSVCFDS
jgi:Universal stress protein family.